VNRDPAFELHRLSAAVRRLAPSHRNPEDFHLRKSDIAYALVLLARRLGAAR
jgi:hypothetical protein